MRCLNRNKIVFYYSSLLEEIELKDESGFLTGEKKAIYSNPIELRANISKSTGNTETTQFGLSENYDKVIVMDKLPTGLNEYSRLWIDIVPQLDENGALVVDENGKAITHHDYIVKDVSKSLNSVSIGISKVKVS